MKTANPVVKIVTIAALATLSACTTSTAPQQTIAPLPIADSGPCCGPVTAEGRRLLRALDGLDVKHHWPANREVRFPALRYFAHAIDFDHPDSSAD
ncbi:hypothetical protein CFB40_34200 [Burkholderia sp. AU31652]|uniref:hypothetical protein n=1 Tax=Burkholderia sp. AU31652 TaxID=2015354 RepID=UPI000B92425D|nr:hypothetical protein [Burkholderia sp. AU31652]OXI79377.1 hypothetical protein CFB40_34200 [Burkholderia sp. AU31652]